MWLFMNRLCWRNKAIKRAETWSGRQNCPLVSETSNNFQKIKLNISFTKKGKHNKHLCEKTDINKMMKSLETERWRKTRLQISWCQTPQDFPRSPTSMLWGETMLWRHEADLHKIRQVVLMLWPINTHAAWSLYVMRLTLLLLRLTMNT